MEKSARRFASRGGGSLKASRYLALETSSPRLSLAAGSESTVLSVYDGPLEWRHAETLFSALETLLGSLDWPVRSLTGVAVSVGPGSFTGIRIGLAAARALGQALDIPVAGINSLEAIAWGACGPARWIAPVLDALRGQVFSALYERRPGGLRRHRSEALIPASRWAHVIGSRLPKRETLWIAGSGSALVRSEAPPSLARQMRSLPESDGFPKASAMLTLARKRWRPYAKALPLYLRRAAAQERRKGLSQR